MQEKNKSTLLKALQGLREHEPPDQIWEVIHFDLDQVEAEVPLRRAISDLPDHEPPVLLWDYIAGEMEQQDAEAPLRKAISELPEYEPPMVVWENIQEQLEEARIVPLRGEEAPSKVIPMWRRPAIAAGFTALLCAMTWLLFSPSGSEKISLSYSTVEVNLHAEESETLRDAQAFEIVLNEFDQQLALSEDPYLVELKRELEDLDLAKRQIEEVMGKYGQDENLVLQITNIEHERSAVLKEMVTKI